MKAQHGQCELDSHPRAAAVARSFESGGSEPDTQSQDQTNLDSSDLLVKREDRKKTYK